MTDFLEKVYAERAAQTHWTNDDFYRPFETNDDFYRPSEWACLISCYVGRIAESACHGFKPDAFREALVKVAAVAMAAYESEDRREQS